MVSTIEDLLQEVARIDSSSDVQFHLRYRLTELDGEKSTRIYAAIQNESGVIAKAGEAPDLEDALITLAEGVEEWKSSLLASVEEAVEYHTQKKKSLEALGVTSGKR